MAYLTIDEVNQYLGISGQDDLISSLIKYGEAFLNTLLGVETLETKDYIETHKYKGMGAYFLKKINPTKVVLVNGSPITEDDYRLEGRVLNFNFYPEIVNFGYEPYIDITYTAGFDIIPDDIKFALLQIISKIYNERKSEGISSYSQGEFDITYRDNKEIKMEIDKIINKYKPVNILG